MLRSAQATLPVPQAVKLLSTQGNQPVPMKSSRESFEHLPNQLKRFLRFVQPSFTFSLPKSNTLCCNPAFPALKRTSETQEAESSRSTFVAESNWIIGRDELAPRRRRAELLNALSAKPLEQRCLQQTPLTWEGGRTPKGSPAALKKACLLGGALGRGKET